MFLASPFLALALAVPTAPAPTVTPRAQTPAQMEALFPPVKEGFTITVDRGSDKTMKLDALVDEFSRVTGIAIQASKDTLSSIRATPVGLNRTIVVPPTEVYRIVEALLIANDFIFIRLSDAEPRIWILQGLQGQGGRGQWVRNDAMYLEERDIALWANHPGTLITTTIHLPNTDVRTLANSMRTMFTDANTQQVLPVGANALIITGFASNVNSIVRMLHFVDDLDRAQGTHSTEPPAKPAPAAK